MGWPCVLLTGCNGLGNPLGDGKPLLLGAGANFGFEFVFEVNRQLAHILYRILCFAGWLRWPGRGGSTDQLLCQDVLVDSALRRTESSALVGACGGRYRFLALRFGLDGTLRQGRRPCRGAYRYCCAFEPIRAALLPHSGVAVGYGDLAAGDGSSESRFLGDQRAENPELHDGAVLRGFGGNRGASERAHGW